MSTVNGKLSSFFSFKVQGLFNLFKSLLESIPYEERFTPPVEDHQLDKMTVMILESMGIKVEPKAIFHYSANNQQKEEQGYGLWM